MNTVFNAHADSNELRELSCLEQNEVSGGRACYKNRTGSNPTRYVLGRSMFFTTAAFQTYSSGAYRTTGATTNVGYNGTAEFDSFCRSKGYNYIR